MLRVSRLRSSLFSSIKNSTHSCRRRIYIDVKKTKLPRYEDMSPEQKDIFERGFDLGRQLGNQLDKDKKEKEAILREINQRIADAAESHFDPEVAKAYVGYRR